MKTLFKNLSLVLLICALLMIVVGCTVWDHQYSENVTKKPTCTEEGVKTYTCTCGDSYTETIEKLPHTEEILPAVDATCTENGLTAGKKCSECGLILKEQKIIPATGHVFTDRYDATCNNEGCDYVREADCPHVNKETLESVGATCTATGLTAGEKCKDCGEILTKQEVAPAKGHNYSFVLTSPTCTEGGYTTYTCDTCGDSYVGNQVEASGHNEKTLEAVAPTCTETGLTEGKQCTSCNTVTVEQSSVPATGHSYTDNYDATCNNPGCDFVREADCRHSETEVIPAVAPTCTATGLTAGEKCKSCQEILTAQESVPAKGHNHTSVVTAPTCTEGGYTTYTCSACSDSYVSDQVPAKGHNEKTLAGKDATCTETGLTEGKQCTACDTITVAQNPIPASGHNHSADWSGNNDQHWHECHCGNKADLDSHSYTNACDTTCNVCEAVREVEGHKYDNDQDTSCNECGSARAVVFNSEIAKEYDLYNLENKTGLTLDLAANVDNAGNLDLEYSVNGTAISGSEYTFTFGSCTDKFTEETLTVTVSYLANGEKQTISYTYKLSLKDTTAYKLANGGFENGMDGWTVVGNIGSESSDRTYWVEAIEFGMDGDKMFSAYAPGALESAVGTLTSSTFKVGGSGFVTFKVGGMRDENYVYVDVVDAETKQILARYYNGLWTDAELSGCKLVAYKADLSAFMGKEVFFRVSDNADSGYGLFFADSFVTYYENEPDGFNNATSVSYAVSGTIYDVFNGGFEMGNVQGWWNNGEIGLVTNANGYWGDNIPYEKVGDYLFTGVESFGADTMREGNRGTLTSSAFELGGTGFISFKLGGGGNVLCYVQVIDAVTGEILARYHQQAQQDAKLIQYVADLSAYIGRTVRIQVVDQADGGWGCVSFDNVVTYYPAGAVLPEGITANDIKGNLKYTIENGSFETGNLDGWIMGITEAGAQNTLGWVLDREIDAGWYAKNDETKDGRYLLTFATPEDVNCENTKGTLTSSTFSLKQGAFVSFKFGGAGGAQNHDVYIELCRADGSVIARFYNDAQGKVNTRMNAYYYQYNGVEVECFFRVVDNSTGDYGCFVIDDFRVNLESAPEGYISAIQ